MNRYRNLAIALSLGCLFLTHTLFSTTIYVNANIVGGAQNGSSWENAYADLQTGLNAARANALVTEIWVAAATYYPTDDSNRSLSFELVQGVQIYGGFAGDELLLSERDIIANPTILNGDIGESANASDNSYHVVKINNLIDRDTRIDGFYIINGMADGAALEAYGGGLLIDIQNTIDTLFPEIANCYFVDNQASYGGAVAQYTVSADLAAVFSFCTFKNNSSTVRGGALHQYKGAGSSLVADYRACSFYGNTSIRGGVLFADGVDGKLVDLSIGWNAGFFNCLLYDNTANYGGAFYIQDNNSTSRLLSRNNTFYNNQGINNSDVLLLNNGGNGELGNCIVLKNTDPFDDFNFLPNQLRVINCNIENGYTGAGAVDIIDFDPVFVDSMARDFRLQACSPSIDIGVNYGTPADSDPAGNPRLYGDRVDMGAYEFVGTSITLPLADLPEQVLVADAAYTDINGWTHYVNCDSDELLLSIYTDGQKLGSLGIDDFEVRVSLTANYGNGATDLSKADYLAEPGEWMVMNRYWEVLNATPFASPVKLRFYYNDQDAADVQNLVPAANGGLNLTDLQPFKVSGANVLSENVLAEGGTYSEYTYSDTSTLMTWTDGSFNGHPYAEFEVSSFSGGGAGILTPIALPVELTNFRAQEQGKLVQLDWATSAEDGSDYFMVEKSEDAEKFFPIHYEKAQGFSSQTYNYQAFDNTPFRGANYYRLKQVDLDGQVQYSGVIVVFIEQKEEGLLVFPNPTKGPMKLQLPAGVEGQTTIQVYDALRRIIWENQQPQQATSSLIPLDLSHLPAGIYVLKVTAKRFRSYQPFILQD